MSHTESCSRRLKLRVSGCVGLVGKTRVCEHGRLVASAARWPRPRGIYCSVCCLPASQFICCNRMPKRKEKYTCENWPLRSPPNPIIHTHKCQLVSRKSATQTLRRLQAGGRHNATPRASTLSHAPSPHHHIALRVKLDACVVRFRGEWWGWRNRRWRWRLGNDAWIVPSSSQAEQRGCTERKKGGHVLSPQHEKTKKNRFRILHPNT